MAWFTEDLFSFFTELEQNNEKAWFDQNRKRYEKSVKEPLRDFAAEMIPRMQALDPRISMLPKDAVFRINRDIRFSKDKTPYKTNAAIVITPGGRGDHSSIGLYFSLDAHSMGIASGLYMPTTSQIHSVRSAIAADLDGFRKLIKAPAFVARFGEVQGERNKVLPVEFRDAAIAQPLLYNKQFFYWAQHDPALSLSDDLPNFVMEHVLAAQPLNRFLEQSLTEVQGQ